MPMSTDQNLCEMSELFEQIFSITPQPLLMLGEDGRFLGASDEGRNSPNEVGESLRERAAHYVSLLRGTVPWLVPQVVDSVRTAASGAVVYEQIHVRRAAWGACLTIVDQTDLRRLQIVDVQSARLAARQYASAGYVNVLVSPNGSSKAPVLSSVRVVSFTDRKSVV